MSRAIVFFAVLSFVVFLRPQAALAHHGGAEYEPGKGFTRSSGAGIHMEQTKGTMEQLASQLAYSAGRPVIDKTGLTGYYAFKLDWFPDNRTAEPDSDLPSMFNAVQEQLGLKLEPTKAPYAMLIIDHAEKPSEN